MATYTPPVNLTRLLWALAGVLSVVVFAAPLAMSGRSEPREPVLVAKQLLPAGTTGYQLVKRGMVAVEIKQTAEGDMSNPLELGGRVLLHDVYPGDQLSKANFAANRPRP